MSAPSQPPASLVSAVTNLYEFILLCRPKNPITFTCQYFEDNVKPNAEYHHVLRALPYLAHDNSRFSEYAVTIFVHLNENNKSNTADILISFGTVSEFVSDIIHNCYISYLPDDIRSVIDNAVTKPFFSFTEFNLYLRLIVRSSILLAHMKEMVAIASSLVMMEKNNYDASDSIGIVDLINCISSTEKIRQLIRTFPTFSSADLIRDGDSEKNAYELYFSREENFMCEHIIALVKRFAIRNPNERHISASDITRELIIFDVV